ncbi:MAG: hypothetical protein M1839_002863 [Geoglossum umbratile]|nr:MAG: hypothetical protein M1839_002863 [Geoglossum umbratile]
MIFGRSFAKPVPSSPSTQGHRTLEEDEDIEANISMQTRIDILKKEKRRIERLEERRQLLDSNDRPDDKDYRVSSQNATLNVTGGMFVTMGGGWLRIPADTHDNLLSSTHREGPFSSQSRRTCRGNFESDMDIAEENIQLRLLNTRVCQASPSSRPALGGQDDIHIFKIVAADAMHTMSCELVNCRGMVYLRVSDLLEAYAAKGFQTLARWNLSPYRFIHLKEVNGLQGAGRSVRVCSSDEWVKQQQA